MNSSESKLQCNENECDYDYYGDTRKSQKYNDEKLYSKQSYSKKEKIRIMYIKQKKETIRRKPECDAGSLFALPSDEKQIGVITAFAGDVLKNVI